jgi:hypothetical protein
MGELFTPWHLIVLLVVAVLFLLPVIFYILTLQKTLQKCAPESQTISPGMVWLYLVPLVNFIFNFFIVLGMAKTLRNEFNRRGIFIDDPTPGQTIGLAMAITLCCTIIPIVGAFAGLAHLVLWIVYWVKIAEYSRALDAQPQMAPALNVV